MSKTTDIQVHALKSESKDVQNLLKNPLLDKDIWHVTDDLSLSIQEHHRIYKFRFEQITPDWLKLLIKIYILLRASRKFSIMTISKEVCYLKKFSCLLKKYSVEYPEQINNQLFEQMNYDLQTQGVSENTIKNFYSVIASFLSTCRIEKWINVNTFWFRGRQKADVRLKIEYLPEEVWNQLDQNLHYLPGPLQRMVLVIRTLGLRIGELCNLRFDCLRQHNGQWRIRFKTEKYHTVDELPIISSELVAVIKEQQEYIRHHLGEQYNKLFCANSATGNQGRDIENGLADRMVFVPKASVMSGVSFNNWLNRLAKKCNIRTKSGELWRFRSHQFRRTVATVMTNAGIRDLIIQKYLRHRSPDMQKYYKHLLEKVLVDEHATLMKEKKYVDITGKIVASHKPTNLITELLRRKLYPITTQYGECHRSILKNPCPTVNACLHCQDWRVSIDDLLFLKEDLKRVEEELEIANKLGMVRQQQGLNGDRNSLLNLIRGLEQDHG